MALPRKPLLWGCLDNASLTCFDAATGAVRWAAQEVHHDIFDYDLVGHPLLVTIQKDGREIPVEMTILDGKVRYERATLPATAR